MPNDATVTPPTSTPNPASVSPGLNDSAATPTREVTAPEGRTSANQQSVYDEIDAIANPGKPKTPEPEKPTQAEEEPDLPDLLNEKPPKEEVRPETPPSKPAEKGQPPAQLRKAYEELKAKHAELEKKLSEAPKEDPEKRALSESLKAREARIKELEEEQKFYAYERSEEYKEKYQKPYEEVSAAATARAVKIKVPGEDGQSRPLTDKEFWSIVGIPDDEEALAVAEKVTGSPSKAALLVSMRNDITSKLEAGNKAKEQYRATAAEREKKFQEDSARQRIEQENFARMRAENFQKMNQEAAKKYPKYFAPEEGDEKGNALLQKGFELVDAVFGDSSKIPPDKLVQYHSAVRNKAAAFDRQVYKLGKATARIAELEKELAAFKASGPGNGGNSARTKTSSAPTWEQEIDALAARGSRR